MNRAARSLSSSAGADPMRIAQMPSALRATSTVPQCALADREGNLLRGRALRGLHPKNRTHVHEVHVRNSFVLGRHEIDVALTRAWLTPILAFKFGLRSVCVWTCRRNTGTAGVDSCTTCSRDTSAPSERKEGLTKHDETSFGPDTAGAARIFFP